MRKILILILLIITPLLISCNTNNGCPEGSVKSNGSCLVQQEYYDYINKSNNNATNMELLESHSFCDSNNICRKYLKLDVQVNGFDLYIDDERETLCDGGLPFIYLFTKNEIDYYTETTWTGSFCYSGLYIYSGNEVIPIQTVITNGLITPDDFLESNWGMNVYIGYNFEIQESDELTIYGSNEDNTFNFEVGSVLTPNQRIDFELYFEENEFLNLDAYVERDVEPFSSSYANHFLDISDNTSKCLIRIKHSDNTIDNFTITTPSIIHNETGYYMPLDGWYHLDIFDFCGDFIN